MVAVSTTDFTLIPHTHNEMVNDEEPEPIVFPDDYDVFDAEIVTDAPGLPRQIEGTKLLKELPEWTITTACSIGTAKNDGAGMAVVLINTSSKACWVSSIYHARTTKLAGDWATTVAAFRLLGCMSETDEVAVFTSSEEIWSQIYGRSTPKQQWTKSYREMALALWGGCMVKASERWSAHRVGRDATKIAQDAARLVRSAGRPMEYSSRVTSLDAPEMAVDSMSTAEGWNVLPNRIKIPTAEHLFPVVQPRSNRRRANCNGEQRDITQLDIMTETTQPTRTTLDFETFLQLRAHPARNSVPREVRNAWAITQQAALTKVLNASNPDESDDAMMWLLSLPSIWLPARASATRLEKHFMANTPFRIEKRSREGEVSSTADSVRDAQKRIEEAVMRKAKNFDLRGAAQILQQEADVNTHNLQSRIQMARAKFPTTPKYPTADVAIEEHVSRFSADELRQALRKVRRTAAPAIDGWSKGLIAATIRDYPQIAELWCGVLTKILRAEFSAVVMRCIRAARLVAIPKKDGGVRPIAVSHFFLKLIGSMTLNTGKEKCCDWQFANGGVQGTKYIVHRLRQHAKEGHTLCKFDLKNAFNEMPRAVCEAELQSTSVALRQYFATVYKGASDMVCFMKGEALNIAAVEGVRQGDATSSFIFCRGLDRVIQNISNAAIERGIHIIALYCYMDDVTIVLGSGQAEEAACMARIVKEEFAKVSMQVNLQSDKSAAMVQGTVGRVITEDGYTLQDPTHPFVVLGAELSNNITSFVSAQRERHTRFFEGLKRMHIHPAVLFTILRICGNPRLIYLCSVMPPEEEMQQLVKEFDRNALQVLNGPSLLNGSIKRADTPLVYDTSGTGFTEYAKVHEQLYSTAAMCASHERTRPPPVELAQTDSNISVQRKAAERSMAGSWLFWTDTHNGLSGTEFIQALAIRLGVIRDQVDLPVTCSCGKTAHEQREFIDHALTCDTFTTYGHVPRHNLVVSALSSTAKTYGIMTVKEPKYYSYESGKRERPDVIFEATPPVATDVTIVQSAIMVGVQAKAAAEKKRKKHLKAVNNAGHIFHPFALELMGFADESCSDLINAIADGNAMPSWLRFEFARDMFHSVSTAMARGRAAAVRVAAERCRIAAHHAYNYVEMGEEQ